MSEYDLTLIENYIDVPEKYVYEFEIKEPNRVRKIITYNKDPKFGNALRYQHTLVSDEFRKNFYERNEHSFAYHKNIRCLDAIDAHLKSHHFIKLDIHHFFESITYDAFMKMYGERFNPLWKTLIRGFFFKDALSIGFVSSPLISDYYMSSFDRDIEEYMSINPKLHYSRYSDDILLSSEEDDITSLNEFYDYLVAKLGEFGLTVNEKKLRRESLSLEKHNSISFLGLNISKLDEVNNKITISKSYILFLLFLIEKNERYDSSCKELCDEINSRVAYLAYSSPISFERFQKKHENLYGVRYDFVPKKVKNRKASHFASEIPDYSQYANIFKFNIHTKVVDTESGSVEAPDNVELASYLKHDEEVVIPDFVDTIGKDAFAHNSAIKKVVLHNHIRSIGQNAFANCSKLESINIPDSVKIIGTQAFRGCVSLKSVTLPRRLRVLNASVFESSGLSKITFGENLKYIASQAFADCKQLKEITLPDTVDKMGDRVFLNCLYLEKVVLPQSLIYVPGGCFKGCSSIKNIDLGDNVISVYSTAFENCFSLKEVHLGKAFANVSYDSFNGCAELEKFIIDKDNLVFRSDITHSLIEKFNNKLVVATKNTQLDGVEIIGQKLFKSSQLKELVLPEGIKEIEPYAFYNCALLEKVVLPQSLEVIGESAFKDCVSLRKIDLPSKVRVLEKEVFANCFRLEEIKVNGDIIAIKEKAFNDCRALKAFDFKAPLEEIGFKAFGSCLSLEKIYIPETVKKLHKHAFANCARNLVSIEVNDNNKLFYSNHSNCLIYRKTNALLLGCRNSVILDGVSEILPYAFENCDELEELHFPSSVKKIGEKALQNCLKLRKITMDEVHEIGQRAFCNDRELDNVVFPESLTIIGVSAFVGCEQLSSVKLPLSIYSVGSFAFAGCIHLKEIFIPKSILSFNSAWFIGCHDIQSIKVEKGHPVYLDDENCNGVFSIITFAKKTSYSLVFGCKNTVVVEGTSYINSGAFTGCNGLEKIHLPASLQSIGDEAFSNCRELKEVTFDEECCLTHIGRGTFKNCPNLKEIVLPKTINFVGAQAFIKCPSLVNVSLEGATLSTLGPAAFAFCENLKSFVFPNNIDTIQGGLFLGCSSLEKMNIPETVKVILGSSFMGCTALKEITLPQGLERFGSKVFSECSSLKKIALPEGLQVLPEKLFAKSGIEEIVIPESVNKIGTFVFEGCENLKKAHFKCEISPTGEGMFKGCSSLKEIIIDKKINNIYKSMFEGCSSLEEIVIPESVKRIESLAFANCTSLKKVTLSTKDIASDAFLNCKSLQQINVVNNTDITFKDGALLVKQPKYWGSNESDTQIILGTSKAVVPDDCALIAKLAFAGLDITSIDLKDVRTINEEAFKDCVKLRKVDLSKVRSIAVGAFINTSLEELKIGNLCDIIVGPTLTLPRTIKTIKIDEGNKYFSDEGCNVLYKKSENTVLFATINSKIPAHTIRIGDCAFENSLFEGHLDIPEGVIAIGNACFRNCKGLKSISIPSSVISIAENAFEGCDNLESIIVSDKNPYFYSDKANKALIGKEHGASVVYASVKEQLSSINGKEGLYGPSLYALCKGGLIPEEVTNIRASASINDNPGHIYIPKQIILLPKYDFINAEDIVIDEANPVYSSYGHNIIVNSKTGKLIVGCKNSVIGDEVISIGKNAFAKCEELRHLHIGKNVVDIDTSAFTGCENIESITVDDKNPIYDSRDGSNMIISRRTDKIVLRCQNSKVPEELNHEPKKLELSKVNLRVNEKFPENYDPDHGDPLFDLSDGDDMPF